jgi:starch synthase (maltosyl-transferring)
MSLDEKSQGGARLFIDMSSGLVPPSSILIERVWPEIDGGRYPVKREIGDVLTVSADIFREGHDHIAAVLRYRRWHDDTWLEAEMRLIDNDRWRGDFLLAENTRYYYSIEAFPDLFGTWREEVEKKHDAGLDLTSELLEGRGIIEEVLTRCDADDRLLIERFLQLQNDAQSQAVAANVLLNGDLLAAVNRNRSRAGATTYDRELEVIVDRERARFAAWYSLFPRSAGTDPTRSATFDDVIDQLPRIAGMGFDVLYFTPIHPIGVTDRKGPNNTLVAGPNDPGVPYAIGSTEGGHDAIEPGLGTLADFRRVVAAANDHGLDIALDLAINASPDHPWVRDHPEWFYKRPDGTIKFAENPPKKYQDIYPINFQNDNWQELWRELKRIVMFWIEQGVFTFRVDNPHTKPTLFWEWLIREVHKTHPQTIFLSEAFTRPKVMRALAKAGFAQSYTYFTWRNFKRELTEYLTELTTSEMKEYFRGNLFANTHDILPYILQEGGRPAFKFRAVLAATLSSVYGVYSGFEVCENTPVPGREEYLNSEKYQYKVWDWDRPGNIADYITQINHIRREHPALQEYENLRFFEADDENVICYGKMTPDRSDNIVVAVNLDPFQPHETIIKLPIDAFGIGDGDQYRADELLSGESFLWTGAVQHVRLDPEVNPAAIYQIRPWSYQDFAEPCF